MKVTGGEERREGATWNLHSQVRFLAMTIDKRRKKNEDGNHVDDQKMVEYAAEPCYLALPFFLSFI